MYYKYVYCLMSKCIFFGLMNLNKKQNSVDTCLGALYLCLYIYSWKPYINLHLEILYLHIGVKLTTLDSFSLKYKFYLLTYLFSKTKYSWN